MNIEELRDYCITKKKVTESFPFDDVTLVFKVMNKMFALISLDGDLRVTLKCDSEKAILLREEYPTVLPGYHMNKINWNTITIDGNIATHLLKEWIDDSYNLIILSLPKKLQAEFHGEQLVSYNL